MKKTISLILLGFMLHKSIAAYYSYRWWSGELNCRKENVALFPCIYEDMGISIYLRYILLTPLYTYQKWELRH